MHTSGPGTDPAEMVTVRYWAGARAAAGVAEERLAGVATVDDLVTHLAESRPGLLAVLPVCSVLVGGRASFVTTSTDSGSRSGGRCVPVCSVLVGGRASTGADQIAPGAVVEVLPPFAGG